MKTLLFGIVLLFQAMVLFSQNVGIANRSPTEKLTISGNLLATVAYSSSSANPDAQHTKSIFAGRTDSVLYIVDSVYRILDPGGNGNYLPNIPLSAILVFDSTGYSANTLTGALELTVEMINLGTGDSLIIANALNSTILFRGGSNMNAATPLKFSGNYLLLYFSSNSNASVGAGFSAVVRRLYPPTGNTGSQGQDSYGNSALFFNSRNGAFKAGLGNNNSGFGSVSIGTYNNAAGSYSMALGNASQSIGVSDVAIGGGMASGGGSLAIGQIAKAFGANSQALGYQARAEGTGSSALSPHATAGGAYSSAIGYNSRAYGANSVALTGGITELIGTNATAIGFNASASKDYSVAIGRNAGTNGVSAIAIGEGSRTNGDYGIALGRNARADIDGSAALGRESQASGVNAVAIGSSTAYGPWSVSIGQNSSSGGAAAVAIGYNANAGGVHAIALGDFVSAAGNSSLATGYVTSATGHNSTAMGNYVSTSGYEGAFTIGDNSTTTVMNTFVANGFRSRFAGGYRLFTNSAANVGAFLNAGANAWAALSDSRLKENFIPVQGESFLEKIAGLPLSTWNYKGQDAKTFRHYGPMAQDFYQAFGKDSMGSIGCDTLINQQDFLGVNLIAIQALELRTQKIELLEKQLSELKDLATEQTKMIEKLWKLVNQQSPPISQHNP